MIFKEISYLMKTVDYIATCHNPTYPSSSMMNILGKQKSHWDSKYSDTPGDIK